MTSQAKTSEWSDTVRDPSAPDDLGRQAFVDSVVRRIGRSKASNSSTVFGLVGPWGSGKSSVIARIRAGLDEDWVVTEFAPWSTGDSAAMALEFVNTLGDLLGAKPDGELKRTLAGYASVAAPLLSGIPFIGGGASEGASQFLEAISARPPWHKQFASISEKIKGLDKRVLIIVDDVDRLGADELLTLLRLVRMLGRFTGVHYLIAYDQDTIEDLLLESGAVGRSSSFMEKIVQYPFEVPPISRAASLRLANENLRDLLTATKVKLDDTGMQRAAELAGILAPQLRTPRILARYREQLLAFADHVNDAELDVLDYAGITWLRLSAHGVWTELARWREELSTGREQTNLTDTRALSDKEWSSRIRDADSSTSTVDTLTLLSFLFPGVSVRGLSYNLEHSRAMSDNTYFGRYLLLTIPEDDVSDELIHRALTALSHDDSGESTETLAHILDFGAPEVANLAYARAAAQRREALTTSHGLLKFLSSRLSARRGETQEVGGARTNLNVWSAREVGISLRDELATPEQIIGLFGEQDSLRLLLQASRLPEFRVDAKRIAKGFATYWKIQLHSRLDELLASGPTLGLVANLSLFASETGETEGLLDFAITDFSGYLRIAQSFARFTTWVGSETRYELEFREADFIHAVSAEMRKRYLEDVRDAQEDFEYEIDDLDEPSVTPDVLRAFTLNALMSPAIAAT